LVENQESNFLPHLANTLNLLISSANRKARAYKGNVCCISVIHAVGVWSNVSLFTWWHLYSFPHNSNSFTVGLMKVIPLCRRYTGTFYPSIFSHFPDVLKCLPRNSKEISFFLDACNTCCKPYRCSNILKCSNFIFLVIVSCRLTHAKPFIMIA
jgi:hypothetical protein